MRVMTVLCCCCLMVFFVGRAAAGQEVPPAAGTDAEKRLDKILRLSEQDQNFLEYLRGTPEYKSKADKGYARLCTARLRSAIAAQERSALVENCKGKYIPGELCGLDHNPLTCAQDDTGPCRYVAQQANADRVILVSYRDGEKKPAVRYRMVRESGEWKLDGARCLP